MGTQRKKETQLSKEIIAVSKVGIVVTSNSMAMVKDSITMSKENEEKAKEMQRQLMDAILSQNALLQNMLLLGQKDLKPYNLGPRHILQPPDNARSWDQHQLLTSAFSQQCSQCLPFTTQIKPLGTENNFRVQLF
ncbi:hypothetical protein UY3_04549 [Chelonia mydas]|uniref:Uncharacterized protein n=1 Tax=Chelonia mydas TaxID=8469 RepID=M7BJW3_CHEMY|nr:hypothetical protein UY3_04549 [Chelonia mydas]